MRIGRAVAVGLALATVGAGSAEAASELSETQRLQDRREVAAGTRAQVLGFQDGRFYANGWHTTGEMGGIVTPPLKLLDSVSFGVNGDVGRAGDEVHERLGLRALRRCRRSTASRCGARTSCPTGGAARCSGSSCATRAPSGAP